LNCLLSRLETLAESSVRHADLISAAEERTHIPVSVLERAYDIAQEAGLDPGLALELVGCGVAFVELEQPASVAGQAHSSNPPEWVAPPAEAASELVLERRLRLTFRRLRTVLEQVDNLPKALEQFAQEADVQPYDYRPPFI